MPARQAYPIEDTDLDKWKPHAERLLANVDGQDIEVVFRELSPEETWRTLPEELALVFLLRHATCLYYWFVDLLVERTGQRAEVAQMQQRGGLVSPSIQAKTTFTSAYALFVAGSYVAVECDRMLRAKPQGDLAKLDPAGLRLDVGRTFGDDMRLCLTRYVGALRSRDGSGQCLVRVVGDLLSITRDYWRTVADQATDAVRRSPADVRAVLEGAVFRHGKFTVAELVVEKYREQKAASFVPVEPGEVAGNAEAIVLLRRQVDRLALYDMQAGRNPFCEVGGLLESVLLDGPPGTGKTTLQRMAMTLLARRAEQVGLPYHFRSLTASDIKTEWYGKTAKLLAELLQEVIDPSRLALLCLDDVDLLFAGDRDAPGTGGGDRDILKGLMDFLSGIGTSYTGSYFSIAATNRPTGTDEALRQRFVARLVIQGPEEGRDYADLLALQLAKARKQGLVLISDKGYEPLSRSDRHRPHEATTGGKQAGPSWLDLGEYCKELRKQDSRFTGRSIKNAVDGVLAAAGAFDVPEAWYTDTAVFRSQTWERKVEMVRGLCAPIRPEVIAAALEHQFNAEARYAKDDRERRIMRRAEAYDEEGAAMLIHTQRAGR